MSKKHKFDLTGLVHHGYIKDGESLYFVSDAKHHGVVTKQPNGEYKLKVGAETLTIHAAAQKFLGQEPPEHASRWLRNSGGKTLYQLWQTDLEEAAA